MKSAFRFIFFFLPAFSSFLISAQSPSVEILTSGTKTSLRGLSVVNDNILWVSGSGGIVGKSSNGGKTWKWITVPGFEKTEFRDIEAFDANVAEAQKLLQEAQNETFQEQWTMRNGETVYFTLPKMSVYRMFVMNHTIHHRGQMSTYIRSVGGKVPGMYGPTADEN